jgi:DNA-binding MarR family transcriptional regulator
MKTFKSKHGEELLANPAFQITEVARLYRQVFDRKVKALGLDRSQWWLISFLVYFEGSTQQELAEVMDIGKAGLGKQVDRLERLGLVQRIPDAVDRRLNRVLLTPKARPLAEEMRRVSEETVAASTATLTAAELVALHKILNKIKKTLLPPAGG